MSTSHNRQDVFALSGQESARCMRGFAPNPTRGSASGLRQGTRSLHPFVVSLIPPRQGYERNGETGVWGIVSPSGVQEQRPCWKSGIAAPGFPYSRGRLYRMNSNAPQTRKPAGRSPAGFVPKGSRSPAQQKRIRERDAFHQTLPAKFVPIYPKAPRKTC